MKPITFPNLNLEFDINPVAFSIGEKDVYWYGIIITAGIILAFILAYFRLKGWHIINKKKERNNKFGLDWDLITDFCVWAIPIGVVCARLYYCIFKWNEYAQDPLSIFEIWNGGLAIYGGVLGGIATAIIFCKVRKINFFDITDFCAPYLAMCQSIGRWGNFVNREAYGQITDSFFKMGIYNSSLKAYEYFQPTFLYESVCTFSIFVILILLSRKRKFSGEIMGGYLLLYGIARCIIEGFRSDSLYIGSTDIRVSQLLSAILIVVAIIILVVCRHREEKAK